MRKIYLACVLVLTALFSTAQTTKGTATVRVTADTKAVLEGSTVEVLRSKDSVLVRSAVTDKNGEAILENLALGNYLARVSMVGYATRYTESFAVTESNLHPTLATISLTPKDASQLANVTVTARKPFIQKLADRIVVNVENSIVSAGSSALDVLERSPGITIDQNDAISLRGRAGVIIMIDGKPSPMSGADLATYLRGLPSGAIERIDIITNPSAKYDASGNSGIIDIRMKKDQRLGTNGTLTAGYGQGVFPKANAGTTFNYRNKKVNLFGNYNYAYRENLNHLIINRNFYENGVFKGSDDKDNYARMPLSNHSARLGADFFVSKNSILGIVSSGNFLNFSRRAEINTVVNDINYHPNYRFLSLGTNKENRQNVVTNLNFKHNFGKTGKELSADIDYGIFNSAALSRTASSYYELNGTKKAEDDILDGDQDGALRLRTGKVDYASPLKGGARFEAGYKFSYVSSDNDAKFYNVLSTGTVIDDYKTNRFFYDEYNNAAYVNYSREFKKFNFQVGLRGEQTNLKTKQQKGGVEFKQDYFEPFPSAYFNYKLKEDKTIGISVSRRIDRPSYSSLNPFLFQVDATIYATGDPHLKPQMTWSYEGSYTVKNLNFTLGYSHSTDPQDVLLARILDVIPGFVIAPGKDSNITIQVPVNLESSDYFGLTATTPIKINRWWNMVNNVNVFYNHVNGNLAGVAVNNGGPSANIRTTNNFTFKKGWGAELNANFNSGGRSGYSFSYPQWGLALGGQKAVMQGKGTLRLNVTDIFWTNLPKATITYKGRYVENYHAFRETRVANLSFTYRFGSNKVQAARRRASASEEEVRRAG